MNHEEYNKCVGYECNILYTFFIGTRLGGIPMGKKIVLFATSGGSGFGNTVSELKPSAPDAEIVEGKVLNKATKQEIAEWIKSIS